MVDELVNTLSNYSNINLNKIRILEALMEPVWLIIFLFKMKIKYLYIICAVVSHLNIPHITY